MKSPVFGCAVGLCAQRTAQQSAHRRKRIWRAFLLVGMALLGVVLIVFVGQVSSSLVAKEALQMSTWDISSSASNAMLTEILDSADIFEELPEGFSDEMALPALCVDVRSTQQADGGIVGFVVKADAALCYEQLWDAFVTKGWRGIASGFETVGSFSKTYGRYRWAFVYCIAIGDYTSVVVQYTTVKE